MDKSVDVYMYVYSKTLIPTDTLSQVIHRTK